MRLLQLLFLLIPTLSFAHELQSISQHVKLNRQNSTGLQQDLIFTYQNDRKIDFGLQGTYLERFDLYDKRVGGFLIFRPSELWTLKGSFLQGMGNKILPEKELSLEAYHSTSVGLSPFFMIKDSNYFKSNLKLIKLGLEIEKFYGFIIIPTFSLGEAKFSDVTDTKSVHDYGLRVKYYKENLFGTSLFVYSGKEVSEAILGTSSLLIDTLTGGADFEWYFSDEFRSEIIFSYTDYSKINNQFLTTTLNLRWSL